MEFVFVFERTLFRAARRDLDSRICIRSAPAWSVALKSEPSTWWPPRGQEWLEYVVCLGPCVLDLYPEHLFPLYLRVYFHPKFPLRKQNSLLNQRRNVNSSEVIYRSIKYDTMEFLTGEWTIKLSML